MAGVIKKLYHPIDNGTVTTAVSQELQEVYPITATSGVYAPEGAFHANDSLDQILRWLDANKISGSGLKTLTVNGTENSLIGSGTIVINTGGGGGGGSDSDFFELDASGNLHVKNDRGLYTGSFISAGGVGSGGGGGQGGDGNATSIAGIPVSISGLSTGEALKFNGSGWVNAPLHRGILIKKYDYATNPVQSNIVDICTGTNSNPFFLMEGDNITLEKVDASNTIKITATGGGGSSYTLPIASSSQLGGIKVGSGLSINSSGVLSATGGSYSLPTASSSTKGGVKIGTDLSMSGEVLSVDRSSLKGYLDGYFVHLTGAESVNGLKTFVDGIAIGNNTKTITLVNGEIVINGDVKVNGNFYATGNVTAGLSNS